MNYRSVQEEVTAGKVVLTFASHRARDTSGVHRIGKPVYSFRRSSYGYYLMSKADAESIIARRIPGVGRLRGPYDDLLYCW